MPSRPSIDLTGSDFHSGQEAKTHAVDVERRGRPIDHPKLAHDQRGGGGDRLTGHRRGRDHRIDLGHLQPRVSLGGLARCHGQTDLVFAVADRAGKYSSAVRQTAVGQQTRVFDCLGGQQSCRDRPSGPRNPNLQFHSQSGSDPLGGVPMNEAPPCRKLSLASIGEA